MYGCSISSCFSALCSVFILWLLMDLPAFCVFKQFSARVGLFRLCACSIISIYTIVSQYSAENNKINREEVITLLLWVTVTEY